MNATPLKVLVVDDEPPIRKLLRMGLGTQGFQTIDAPNGKAAIELMAEQPDLVILDLGLPDVPGLSCCAKFARGARICRSSCSPAAVMRQPKWRHLISVP